jgi:uncharacterized protein
MNEIDFQLDAGGRGAFVIEKDGKRVAEMAVAIRDNNLTVFHTEVSEELKGQGIAAKLLATMVEYARTHALKVIPLCPYVAAQFKRHPDDYADIWNQQWHKS